MATIGWDETIPLNTANAGTADDELRSLKTALRTGLEDAMYWQDGSSLASAGQMKPGKARAYFDTLSRVSANTDGALMATSNTSQFFHVGSAGTMFLGGARVIENANLPTGQSHWVVSTFTMGIGTGNRAAFPLAYSASPTVIVSAETTSTTTVGIPIVSLLSATGLIVQVFRVDGVAYAGGSYIAHVVSSGTVNF